MAPQVRSGIHVIPAIAVCPVSPNRGHWAKGACLMSTVAITLAISSVAPEGATTKTVALWGPREKDRAAHLRFFFQKKPKAIKGDNSAVAA
jgi:hypothetical protein